MIRNLKYQVASFLESLTLIWPWPSVQIVDCCFMNSNSDLVMIIQSEPHLGFINIHCYLFACQMLKYAIFASNSFNPSLQFQSNEFFEYNRCIKFIHLMQTKINFQVMVYICVHFIFLSRRRLLWTSYLSFSVILSGWPKNCYFFVLPLFSCIICCMHTHRYNSSNLQDENICGCSFLFLTEK